MEIKESIIRLRKEGLSYSKIQKKLGCSKSTISYHCGTGQRERSNKRSKKHKHKNVLATKIGRFSRKENASKKEKSKDLGDFAKILRSKIWRFSRMKNGRYERHFDEKELLEKMGKEPKCYLTGRAIDLGNAQTYNLDHVIPRTKGGDNSLKNCGLACKAANQAKHNMLLEEFVQLCKDVVKSHGMGPS